MNKEGNEIKYASKNLGEGIREDIINQYKSQLSKRIDDLTVYDVNELFLLGTVDDIKKSLKQKLLEE